jgi:hypothetical protein
MATFISTAAPPVYGPKVSGAWPGSGVSLVGPAGATGATGAQGPQGPLAQPVLTGSTGPIGPAGTPGSDGATGATGPTGVTGPAGVGLATVSALAPSGSCTPGSLYLRTGVSWAGGYSSNPVTVILYVCDDGAAWQPTN